MATHAYVHACFSCQLLPLLLRLSVRHSLNFPSSLSASLFVSSSLSVSLFLSLCVMIMFVCLSLSGGICLHSTVLHCIPFHSMAPHCTVVTTPRLWLSSTKTLSRGSWCFAPARRCYCPPSAAMCSPWWSATTGSSAGECGAQCGTAA